LSSRAEVRGRWWAWRPRTARAAGRWLGAVAAAGFGGLIYAYLSLPDVRSLRASNPSTTAFIELRAREALRDGRQPRRVQQWVKYGAISPAMRRAVLTAEDDAFFQHEGLDLVQLQESIEIDWAHGRFVRGASTITQQLAKNLYLSPSRNPVRKLRELVIARRLEVELPKGRILELYLNVIEWGDGVYGVEAAARTYFGIPARSIGSHQAALLAGAIVNPRVLNPARPNARLLRRQRLILRRMHSVVAPAAPASEAATAAPPNDAVDDAEAQPADTVEAPADGVEAAPDEPLGAEPGDDGGEAQPNDEIADVEADGAIAEAQ
jgi:monofunctional biosynthetic peptidoglycan transglycosylase